MKTKSEVILLQRLNLLSGKVKYTHKSEYDGRRQTVALLKIGDKYYQGTACVSHKDIFDKKIGRAVALGRAFKMFDECKDIIPDDKWKFKEDR